MKYILTLLPFSRSRIGPVVGTGPITQYEVSGMPPGEEASIANFGNVHQESMAPIHLAFVLQGQRGQWLGQGKHYVEVFAPQEFGLTLLQPLGSGQGLAPGAMPIRAGVVGVTFVPTLVTLLEMAAQRCRATQFDSTQHTLLPNGQSLGMHLAELGAVCAHNVGNFQGRPRQRGRAP